MNQKISSNHSTIQNLYPRSRINLQDISSDTQSFELVPKPTKRYLKKQSLRYLYCPDCESKDITFYGKSSVGSQKHRCKSCNHQFVAKFDAIFPKSKRRTLFEQEFLSHLKPSGLLQKGCGQKKYWEGALIETLSMIESDTIRIWANRMIKSSPVTSDREYRVLFEFVLFEAYVRVTG